MQYASWFSFFFYWVKWRRQREQKVRLDPKTDWNQLECITIKPYKDHARGQSQNIPSFLVLRGPSRDAFTWREAQKKTGSKRNQKLQRDSCFERDPQENGKVKNRQRAWTSGMSFCIMKQIKMRLWKQIQTIWNTSFRPSFYSNKPYPSHTFIQPYHRVGDGLKRCILWAYKDDSLTPCLLVLKPHDSRTRCFWKSWQQENVPFSEKCLDKESGEEVPFLGLCWCVLVTLHKSMMRSNNTHFLSCKINSFFSLSTRKDRLGNSLGGWRSCWLKAPPPSKKIRRWTETVWFSIKRKRGNNEKGIQSFERRGGGGKRWNYPFLKRILSLSFTKVKW